MPQLDARGCRPWWGVAVVAVAVLAFGVGGCAESENVATDDADEGAGDVAGGDAAGDTVGSGGDAGEVDVGPADGPTCDDGLENGQETAVDCGGPECPPCPEYAWETGEWSACDPDTCKQTREVNCVRDGQFEAVDPRCPDDKPATEQTCKLGGSPSISGSWQAECGMGSCGTVAAVTGDGNSVTVEGTSDNNKTELTLTELNASGSWSQSCASAGDCDTLDRVTTSGSSMTVHGDGGSNTGKVEFTGATLSGSFERSCSGGSCATIEAIEGEGAALTITDTSGQSGGITLSGEGICP